MLLGMFEPDDRDNTLLRNVSKYLSSYTLLCFCRIHPVVVYHIRT